MPKCKICDYQKENIVYHLKTAHNHTTQSYRLIYPGADVISDKMKEHARKSITKYNKSELCKTRTAAKNKTLEHRLKVKQGLGTLEAKKKMSNRTTTQNKKNWENIEYREKMSKKISKAQKQVNKNPEVTARKSEMFRNLWKNQEISQKMLNSHKLHPFGKQIKYKNFYCRSEGEYEVVLLLENIGATNILQETHRIPYLKKGKESTYIPDFECTLNGIKYIIEVKYSEPHTEFIDKVNGALDYCEKNGYVYCWIRRFIETKQIELDRNLNMCMITRSK